MIATTTAPPTPLFPVGYRVNVGYLDLYRADECGTTRDGTRLPAGNARVLGTRLIPEETDLPEPDGEESSVTSYPRGWEYLIGRDAGNTRGWYPEAELLAKGYAPTATPAETADVG